MDLHTVSGQIIEMKVWMSVLQAIMNFIDSGEIFVFHNVLGDVCHSCRDSKLSKMSARISSS